MGAQSDCGRFRLQAGAAPSDTAHQANRPVLALEAPPKAAAEAGGRATDPVGPMKHPDVPEADGAVPQLLARPAMPLTPLRSLRAGSLGRKARTAAPARHISESRMALSSCCNCS